MRQSLKIALSLLIAIALFSGFAVFAFSGLFNLLETDFFSPRVEKELKSQLASVSAKIDRYHALNTERFQARISKDYVVSAFDAIQTEANIRSREQDFGSLQKDLTNLLLVRLLDPDGKRLHFSTGRDDVARTLSNRIEYKTLDQAESARAQSLPGSQLANADGGTPKLLIDGSNDRFIYSLPVYQSIQSGRIFKGTALFYVASVDLLAYLLRTPQTSIANVTLMTNGGILLNFPSIKPEGLDVLSDGIGAVWASRAGEIRFAGPLLLADSDGRRQSFRVFAQELSLGGFASFLLNSSEFEMSSVMKGLLLASVFFTVFLIIYLIFNLKPDPLEVVAQRVKRFQVQLLEQLIERNGGPDWGKWKGELEARKGEITHQIQRGLGRISKKQKPELDGYISKSWNEIIDILGRRAETIAVQPSAYPVDFSRLESLIQKALKNAQFVVPRQKVDNGLKKLAVEELRAEDVEELVEEEAEEAEEISEAEEIEEVEAVEEAGEAEEIEEVEAVEEAEEAEEISESEEIEEVEAVEEAGEAEEIEEAEAVEEAGEAEEIEEAEAVEEVGEAEEIEEAEAAGEAPELEEADRVPGFEAADGIDSGNGKGFESAKESGEETPEDEAAAPEMEELEAVHEPSPLEGKRGLLQRAAAMGRSAVKVSELVEVRIPSIEARGPVIELDFPAYDEPRIETSEEVLEELEPLLEMQPLPPIPIEEGLELLPMADEKTPGKTPFAEGWSLMSDHDREGEVTEGPDSSETLEELESVDVVEVLDEAAGPSPQPSGSTETAPSEEEASKNFLANRREIESLIESGIITVLTMDQLQALVDESKSAIVMEDGVYRIKEDVYQANGKVKQGKLKELAEEVIRHERTEGPAVESEGLGNGFSGIGDLIREEETLDLAKVAGVEKEAASNETLSLDKEKSWTMGFKKNGIDYDEFLSSYPRSFTHTSQMKSLVEVSRRVSAVGAGIILRKSEGYIPDLAIGSNEKTLHTFKFASKDAFFERLNSRSAYIFNRAISELKCLRGKIDEEDLRYMKRLVFIPASYRSQDAYLFFLFSSDIELRMESLFSSLRVQ
jgi:hypothetical protein